jgi:hypothetical protein
MRTYIIGNDGVALCRKGPATVSNGEIVVASKEELQAAPLNGKRFLALWNALPDVDKRRKVGDRAALIEQLWSAIEALPDPEPRADPKRPSKRAIPRPAMFEQRHKIIHNRVALGGEESVSVVTGGSGPPSQPGEPTHAHLHHRQ